MKQGGLQIIDLAERTTALILDASKPANNNNYQGHAIVSLISTEPALAKFCNVYEKIVKSGVYSFLLMCLVQILPFIQLITIIFNPLIPGYWTPDNTAGLAVNYMSVSLSFASPAAIVAPSLYGILIPVGLAVVSFVIGGIAIATQNNISSNNKLWIILMQVSLLITGYCSFISIYCNLGRAMFCLQVMSATNIVVFIVLLLCAIMCYMSTAAALKLFCYSSFPIHHLAQSFDGLIVLKLFLINGIYTLFGSMMPLFYKPIQAVILLCKLAFSLYLTVESFSFPMSSLIANSVLFSVASTTGISDIFGFLFCLGVSFSQTARIIVLIVFLFANCIVGYYALRIYKKRRAHPEKPSLRQARTLLRSAYIDNDMKALDGTYSFTLGVAVDDCAFWIEAASMVAMIPSNHPMLDQCLSHMRRHVPLDVFDKVRFLHLIHVARLRSSTKNMELDELYEKCTSLSAQAIEATRRFWAKLSPSVTDRDTLVVSSILDTAKAAITSAIEAYPNDSTLASIYSDFLIEAKGDIIKGTIWQKKAQYLDRGYTFNTDYVFLHFIRSESKLLKEGIIDSTGRFASNDTQTTGTVSTVTADERIEDDIDEGLIDQLAEDQVTNARARAAFAASTRGFSPKGLLIADSTKRFFFIVYFLLLIATSVIVSTLFTQSIHIHDAAKAASHSLKAISYTTLSNLMRWAQASGDLYTNTDLQSANLPAQSEKAPIKLLQYKEAEKYWSEYGFRSYVGILNNLTRANFKQILDPLMKESVVAKVCDNTGAVLASEPAALRRGILAIFHSTSLLSTKEDTYFSSFGTTKEFCELFDVYDSISQMLNKVNIEDSSTHLPLICLAAILLLIIPMTSIPYLITKKTATQLLEAMKSVTPEDATAASMPIIKQGPDAQNSLRVSSSGTFLSIVVLLVILVCLIASEIIVRGVPEKANVIARTSILGSMRISTLIRILEKTVYLNFNPAAEPDLEASIQTAIEINKNFTQTAYAISSQVQDLHINDLCTSNTGNAIYDFYHCLGYENAFATYILYARDIASTATDKLKNARFINLERFLYEEMETQLTLSDSIMTRAFESSVVGNKIIALVLMIVATLVFAYFILLDIKVSHSDRRNLKAQLVLLRHLDPAAILRNEKIVETLLVKRTDTSDLKTDYASIVFEQTREPIVCVGENFIVEVCNPTFCEVFKYPPDHIIGRELSMFILQPEGNVNEMSSVSAQGAVKLYDKMNTMYYDNSEVIETKYPVECVMGDGKKVITNVEVHGVRNKENEIASFVIIAGKDLAKQQAEEQLTKAKAETESLRKLLVPREIEMLFFDSYGVNESTISNAIVISVMIPGIDDAAIQDPEKVSNIWNGFRDIAKNYPPFIVQSFFGEAGTLIGWPTPTINAEKMAATSIDLLKNIQTYISEISNSPGSAFATFAQNLLVKLLPGEFSRYNIRSSEINNGISIAACLAPGQFLLSSDIVDRLPLERSQQVKEVTEIQGIRLFAPLESSPSPPQN